ncbi:hypothetical protein, partial [Serratia marcescens]|uniref:hypothetical protein n=1 Tax=Serratia marcescens TaxID=615 RepID=UPI0028134B7C
MLSVFGKEPLAKRSGKKADMKTEYRLLHDVVHRGLIAKAGAFDAYTEEKFILMTIIVKRIPFNWSAYLFAYFAGKFKEKKGNGYVPQISAIIYGTPEIKVKS